MYQFNLTPRTFMKSVWARTLCRLLMVLMVWTPMHMANAGMIGTDQIVSTSAAADRDTVMQFLGRAEVTNQLQALGIDPAAARDRVAAMTDDEVRVIAGKIATQPAGGDALGVLLLLLVVGAVVWWIWFRR
jgi:hypothetical protein